MKAIIVKAFGPANEHARLGSVQTPIERAGHVVIDVQAAGLNFADLLTIEGKYQSLVPPPFIPGKEAAGIVKSVADDVRTLKPGDRVLAFLDSGAFAEQATAAERDCHSLPAGLAMADAVSLGLNYQTAYLALTDRARLQRGESVLVTGASGGVGLACIQMAKLMGARVLAGIARQEKRLLVESAGADAIIDLSGHDLKNTIRQQVQAAIGAGGVDVVLETVGGDVFDGCLRAMAWCGRIVIIGFVAGRIPSIMANYLLVKNIAAVGMYWDSYRTRNPKLIAHVQRQIFEFWETGQIHEPKTHLFDMAEFPKALDASRARRTAGRIVIQPNGATSR